MQRVGWSGISDRRLGQWGLYSIWENLGEISRDLFLAKRLKNITNWMLEAHYLYIKEIANPLFCTK